MWKKFANSKSQLKEEVIGHFQRGDSQWSTTSTVQEKEQSLNFIIAGLQVMEIWIQKENDFEFKQTLKNIYLNRCEDLNQRKQKLQIWKNQNQFPQPPQQIQAPPVYQQFYKQQETTESDNDKEYKKLIEEIKQAILIANPKKNWDDIIGLTEVKAVLEETILLPTKFPSLFKDLRKPKKSNLLIFGPAGTGKTLLGESCATETKATFFYITPAIIISKYQGESEKRIKILFQLAKQHQPSIIFFDNIDALLGNTTQSSQLFVNRMIGEFSAQVSNLENNQQNDVNLLAATNDPWSLPQSLITKFEKRLYATLPNLDDRRSLIRQITNQEGSQLIDSQVENLAALTEGYSGYDLRSLAKEAFFATLRKIQTAKKFRQIQVNGQIKWTPVEDNKEGVSLDWHKLDQNCIQAPQISYQDYQNALNKIKKTLPFEEVEKFQKWDKQFGYKQQS